MLATRSRYAGIVLAILVTMAATPGDVSCDELEAGTPVLVQENAEIPDRQRPMTLDQILEGIEELPCQRSMQCRLSSYTPSWVRSGVFATDPFEPPAGADRRIFPFPDDESEGVWWNISPNGGTIEGKVRGFNVKAEANGLAVPGEPKEGTLMLGREVVKGVKVFGGLGVAEGEKPRPKIGAQLEGKYHVLSVDINPLDVLGKSSVTGYYRPNDSLSIGLGLGPHGFVFSGGYRSEG